MATTPTQSSQTLENCKGHNKYGNKCKRKVKQGCSFCLYHSVEVIKPPPKPTPIYRCCGKTNRYNKCCSKKVFIEGGYCKAHIDQHLTKSINDINELVNNQIKEESNKFVALSPNLSKDEMDYGLCMLAEHIDDIYEDYANNVCIDKSGLKREICDKISQYVKDFNNK